MRKSVASGRYDFEGEVALRAVLHSRLAKLYAHEISKATVCRQAWLGATLSGRTFSSLKSMRLRFSCFCVSDRFNLTRGVLGFFYRFGLEKGSFGKGVF